MAALAPDAADALVILGLGHVTRVVGAFERYAPLVPVGGYVVVENTVVNGRPVVSGFGPGPTRRWSPSSVVTATSWPTRAGERYTVTFNGGGYLRRVQP